MILHHAQIAYQEADLAEFQAVVEKKLAIAQREFNYYQEQIEEAEGNSYEDRDGWAEDAMVLTDLEIAKTLAERQRKYIVELEMALNRIRNKTYGICKATGELIDKRRLLAVPTTTLSLAAKMMAQVPVKVSEVMDDESPKPAKAKAKPVIITKIIKKNIPTPAPVFETAEVEEDDDEDYFYEDNHDYDNDVEQNYDDDTQDYDDDLSADVEYSEEEHHQY